MQQLYRFELESDAPIALDIRRACVIESENGQLWLTIDGFPTDHWLNPGEPFALAPGQRAWVSAAAPLTRVRMTGARQRSAWLVAPWLKRFGRLLAPTFGPINY